MSRTLTVLCLCTGNSARSILAEALFNHLGAGRVRAFSAGSRPAGQVNPHALALLAAMGIPVAAARSKSWDEFSGPRAPRLDVILTLCDSAAAEECPAWPGHPVTAHWGVEDPAAASGTPQTEAAFREAFEILEHRVRALLALSPADLPQADLETALRRIGTSRPPSRRPAG